MNKYKQSMQICNVKGGIYILCLILSFVYLTFVPSTIQNFKFLEGFTFEACIVFLIKLLILPTNVKPGRPN